MYRIMITLIFLISSNKQTVEYLYHGKEYGVFLYVLMRKDLQSKKARCRTKYCINA